MKVTLPLTVDCEVEIPKVPNFIRLSSGVTIDIKDIHESTLAKLGDSWKEALLVTARERKRELPEAHR